MKRAWGSERWAWWCVVAFALVAFAALMASPIDSTVISDDGAYQLTVRSLELEGRWSVDYVLSDVDPDRRWTPYHRTYTDEGEFPYTKRPAWVVALSAANSIGGLWGQRALVALAGTAAVAATVMLARRLNLKRGALVAGAVMIGSPILFNSLQFWAHAAATAGIGLAYVAVTDIVGEHRRAVPPAIIGIAGIGLAAAVRPGGALFGIGLGAAVAAAGVRTGRWRITTVGGAFAGVAALVHLASGRWGAAIVGSDGVGSALRPRSSGDIGSILGGAWTTLVGVSRGGLFSVLAIAAMVLAVVLVRSRDIRAATLAIAVATVALGLRMVVAPDIRHPGLLAAWPVALLALCGVGGSRGDRWLKTPLSVLITAASLGVAGVLATQYAVGGGGNWGGRFITPVLPLLAVLIGIAVERTGPGSARLGVAVVACSAMVGYASLALDHRVKGKADQLIATADSAPEGMVVVTSLRYLPRAAWRTYPERPFVLTEDGDVDGLAEALHGAGIERVALYEADAPTVAELTGRPPRDRDEQKPLVVDVRSP